MVILVIVITVVVFVVAAVVDAVVVISGGGVYPLTAMTEKNYDKTNSIPANFPFSHEALVIYAIQCSFLFSVIREEMQ